MSKKEKLIQRFVQQPSDFEWFELQALLKGFGYNEAKNNGSRRKFYNETLKSIITLHEPHPRNVLKAYAMKEVYQKLQEAGIL
jgi:hypothetical protein